MTVAKPQRAGLLANLVREANQNAQARRTEELPGATHNQTSPVLGTAPVAAEPDPTLPKRAIPRILAELPRATSGPAATASDVPPGMVEITIDPAKTRMNDLHRRSQATMSGDSLDELVRLIRAGGQAVPALGWRLERPQADGVEVVLVYGARRRAATLQLGIGLNVLLMPLPPLQADLIRLMHAENRGRRNYVALEDAREYAGYLECGAFENASAMAAGLEVDKSILSRLLSLLTLPKEVLQLYEPNPAWLQLKKGAAMASEAKNAAVRAKLVAAATAIAKAGKGTDPTAELMQVVYPRIVATRAHDLKDAEGRVLGVLAPAPGGKGGLVLKLRETCPLEICAAVTDLLRQHFPKAGL